MTNIIEDIMMKTIMMIGCGGNDIYGGLSLFFELKENTISKIILGTPIEDMIQLSLD